jgi:hypothetical protein
MAAFLPTSAAFAFCKDPPSTNDGDNFERPRVITLCGSTRFMNAFEEANRELTLQGNVVFSVATKAHEGSANVSEAQKLLLDKVHFEKIRLSDEIFVINIGGYVGPSTRREIEFATRIGKAVRFLEA